MKDRKILALDASTEACSVALLKNGHVEAMFEMAARQHTVRLLPMVNELLDAQAVSLSELDLIVYGRGPGAFTGIRIAAAFAQGLALSQNIPLLGVSTLFSMAAQVPLNDNEVIATVLDARMGEVYIALWKSVPTGLVLVKDEYLLKPEHIDWQAQWGIQPDVVTGNGVALLPEALLSELNIIQDIEPKAEFQMEKAIARLDQGGDIHFDESMPQYLRDNVTY